MAGYNLQQFDEKFDFSIWQQKMKGILIQQKVFKATDRKFPANFSEEKKLENDEFAYSSIILNLSDTVLRKVGKQSSAKELWDKLEELYTETSLPSTIEAFMVMMLAMIRLPWTGLFSFVSWSKGLCDRASVAVLSEALVAGFLCRLGALVADWFATGCGCWPMVAEGFASAGSGL
ncbi:hypothetical protein Sango_1872200 [Sesamum angolense]|uniref:Gag-pol polyprotein n=1 Tax=Sesamum angolense TaxID=2727404 RepID=A0AAE1WIL7_9LAMI|nr:hypothetical protein Sango_1872200 [Sesamum angolense]